jgi:lambda family phage portal protein
METRLHVAIIEALDLSEVRAQLSLINNAADTSRGLRTLTSDATMAQLGGASGWGGFTGAKMGRLTGDWPTASRSIDQDLMVDLRRLRARARNQAMNSPIASKFLGMVRMNVVGQHGVKLAFKVPQQRKSKKGNGLDDAANTELARAWAEWGKKGSCTVCGRYSWRELQRLIAENTARDGEQFIRKVYVPKSVNPFGFQLQLIDADQVDDSYNVMDMPGGVQVRMGVEVNRDQRPLAYHIFNGNPFEGTFGSANRIRVPADQIIHYFIPHRTGQTRGYPWFASTMSQLNMLDGYFYAELTAARIGASVVMSIESDPNAPAEEIQSDGINADGSKAVDIGYGKALEMPTGQHLNDHTPSHPTNAFEPFIKQSGREIASGMNVAYHKLCNDLAGINYSSGRLGELEERDFWMEMQTHMVDDVCEMIYDPWLAAGLMWGAIELPLSDRKRFTGPSLKWEPRRWPWVDPLKDVQASTLLVQNGFETNESILNSQGRDLEDVYNQRKREQDLADELGLKFGTDIRGQGTSEINSEEMPEDDGSSGEPKDNEEKPAAQATTKPAKPKAGAKPAPAKPKGRELVRGMHPANAALWNLTEDEK